jgi:hypothetical protein
MEGIVFVAAAGSAFAGDAVLAGRQCEQGEDEAVQPGGVFACRRIMDAGFDFAEDHVEAQVTSVFHAPMVTDAGSSPMAS